MSAFLEIRQYRAQPGKRDELVKIMEDVIVPFQESLGVNILGTFRSDDDADLFVWIRRFDSEEQRIEQYEAMYQCDEWKHNIGPLLPALMELDTMDVRRVVPTAGSSLS